MPHVLSSLSLAIDEQNWEPKDVRRVLLEIKTRQSLRFLGRAINIVALRPFVRVIYTTKSHTV